MAAPALPSSDDDRRVDARLPVSADSTLRDRSMQPIDAVLRDISATGCRIECAQPLENGSVASIGLAGAGTALGRIVRRDGDEYGFEFLQPLAHAEVAKVGQTATVVAFTLREQIEWLNAVEGGETSTMPDPDRWPPAARLGFILGTSALCWAGIAALVL